MTSLRTLNDLIISNSLTWTELQEDINKSKMDIEILPVVKEFGETTLCNLQVTSNSNLGSLALNTGGVIVDSGWLRILGGGTNQMASIATANSLNINDLGYGTPENSKGYLIVAYDVAGGLFAIDGGAFGQPGCVVYAGQDTGYEWIMPGFESHSHFLYWCFNEDGSLQQFYQHMRWQGWKQDVSNVNLQQAYSFFPFLSTVEGQDIEKVSKRVVPLAEIVGDFLKPAW